MPSELEFKYNEYFHPTGARCRLCGEEMVIEINTALRRPADIVEAFANQLIAHRLERHPETIGDLARLG